MKKYGNLHPGLVERICHEEREQKKTDKAAKTRLHQLYGAYIRPNSNKKAKALIKQLTGFASSSMPRSPTFHNHIVDLLGLHSSTSERLPYYSDFYNFILSHTGTVQRVLDLGCGFNPFSLPFYPHKLTEYHAVDIDLHTKDLINAFFEIMHLPKYATCEDLVSITPKTDVDLALMLKLFPVLEAKNPGRAYSLANELNTTWLAITFPTKSLGGKKKGMATNYKANFEEAMNKNALSNFKLTAECRIGNELIFILKRDSQGLNDRPKGGK